MSLIHNERTELLANAFDRASTACVAVGLLGPAANALYGMGAAHGGLLFWPSVALWLVAAAVLHLLARRVLGGLR